MFNCYINIIESIIPISPPTIQCRYELGINESDITTTNVSIGLSHDLMIEIVIINVRVCITRSRYATYTDKRHRGISADMLERKWEIGVDKEKRTLQPTTKDNVRSALKPLAWRYRTEFLSQRLH